MNLDHRKAVSLDGHQTETVKWLSCGPERDQSVLDRWGRAVGPAVVDSTPRRPLIHASGGGSIGRKTGLTVVSWNVRVGGGSFPRFWDWLERDHGIGSGGESVPFVLLLQEVFRRGGGVPEIIPEGAVGASPIDDKPPESPRQDVVVYAQEKGLSLVYLPSMRNGAEVDGAPEDRGNALLSNLPLEDLAGLELPFERQRRVAVAGKVSWAEHTYQVCTLHLDNRAPWSRAWRSLGGARGRQMEGLLANLSPEADIGVLGGDFNTWVRETREPAYQMARQVFPLPDSLDTGPTHSFELGGFLRRSDHIMCRAPEGWTTQVLRGPEQFGSDHYPLVARLEPPVAQ